MSRIEIERADASRALRRAHLLTPSTLSAGFLAVLVSYAGPLLIYLQAARAMGVPAETFSSWVFAISLAAGVSSIVLSLLLRAPVVTAWSAPGTVLLISLGTQLPFAEVVGAYLVTALAIVLLGVTGLFDRLVAAIPAAVASGMMAGILFGFGVDAMSGLQSAPVLFAVLLLGFLVSGVWTPRYAVLVLLGLALVLARTVYDAPLGEAGLALATPELTWPAISLPGLLGLALPLFVTTMTGQFLPGMAILRANGYAVSARPILVLAGLASLPAALLGGITTALAAITLALCAGPDAHPDRDRRYAAGVAAGAFFCLGGVLAGSVVALLGLLPVEMIALLAGLALLGAILKSLSDTVNAPENIQAGLLTFIVTTADIDLLGIGSAFWGIVVGVASVHVVRLARKLRRTP